MPRSHMAVQCFSVCLPLRTFLPMIACSSRISRSQTILDVFFFFFSLFFFFSSQREKIYSYEYIGYGRVLFFRFEGYSLFFFFLIEAIIRYWNQVQITIFGVFRIIGYCWVGVGNGIDIYKKGNSLS